MEGMPRGEVGWGGWRAGTPWVGRGRRSVGLGLHSSAGPVPAGEGLSAPHCRGEAPAGAAVQGDLRAADPPQASRVFICHMKTLRHGEADVTPEVSGSGPAGVRTRSRAQGPAPSAAPHSDPGCVYDLPRYPHVWALLSNPGVCVTLLRVPGAWVGQEGLHMQDRILEGCPVRQHPRPPLRGKLEMTRNGG